MGTGAESEDPTMENNSTQPRQEGAVSRRRVLTATAGLTTLLAVGTTSGQRVQPPSDVHVAGESQDRSAPEATAQAYVSALDADDREAVNGLIAEDGPLEAWGRTEFSWVSAFEFEFVELQTTAEDDRSVTGDVVLTVGGKEGTVRYRFRELDDGGWRLWESVDGLRFETEGAVTAEEAARSYVRALDEGDREAVNELIAGGGELEPWGSREFDWVGAFEFELTDFRTVSTTDREVTGEIDLTVGGNERTVRYRFRELDDGGWKLWASPDGLRFETEGAATAEAAAESYFSAVDICDRERAHELLADDGELGEWGEMQIAWYGTFDVRLLEFEPIEESENAVTATLEIDVAGMIEEFEYEFRRIDDEGWKLWDTAEGIRDL